MLSALFSSLPWAARGSSGWPGVGEAGENGEEQSPEDVAHQRREEGIPLESCGQVSFLGSLAARRKVPSGRGGKAQGESLSAGRFLLLTPSSCVISKTYPSRTSFHSPDPECLIWNRRRGLCGSLKVQFPTSAPPVLELA